MFKKGVVRKYLLLLFTISLLVMMTMVFLAKRDFSSSDTQFVVAIQKISKSLIMRVLDKIERNLSSDYAPTPFDSPGFSYADLSHPYFEKIRNDKRVGHFYTNHKDAIDVSDAILMREYLRDLFPHGSASRNYLHINVLEMIDASEKGERFLCGNISKMLVQLIQAGGTQARTIGLQASDSGHVVVEIWSKRYNKWVVLDPDYNVHYTNIEGLPLSAIELYKMSQLSNYTDTIVTVIGKSPNTLYKKSSKLIERYYKNGIAINYYNRWVDKNLPRRNPARSPVIMGYYIGNSYIQKLYYKHGGDAVTEEIVSKLYMKPPENIKYLHEPPQDSTTAIRY